MNLQKLITRKRLKWTGLAATVVITAAMIASYWYWPYYGWMRQSSITRQSVQVVPGALSFIHESDGRIYNEPLGYEMGSRAEIVEMTSPAVFQQFFPIKPPAWVWFPRVRSVGTVPDVWTRYDLPLWIPVVLFALPTMILIFRDSMPKPGCCKKCRYDLTGLSGDTCPECGTKIAMTDSNNALASAAKGEPDEAGGENGDCLGENGVS